MQLLSYIRFPSVIIQFVCLKTSKSCQKTLSVLCLLFDALNVQECANKTVFTV